jgi:hypothetical protein
MSYCLFNPYVDCCLSYVSECIAFVHLAPNLGRSPLHMVLITDLPLAGYHYNADLGHVNELQASRDLIRLWIRDLMTANGVTFPQLMLAGVRCLCY